MLKGNQIIDQNKRNQDKRQERLRETLREMN